MKPLSTPRHLLQLEALFARRGDGARAPDDRAEPYLQAAADGPEPRPAASQLGRIVAEVALIDGGRRAYPPRREAQVIDARGG